MEVMKALDQMLPRFSRSFRGLDMLRIQEICPWGFWQRTTPAFRLAIRRLCDSPGLKTIGIDEGIPVSVWCHNPTIARVNLSKAYLPSTYPQEVLEDPSLCTVKEYSPIESLDVTIGNGSMWLNYMTTHPKMVCGLKELVWLYASSEDALGSMQRLLETTTSTLTHLHIWTDNTTGVYTLFITV